jgi:hypothetical protein
MRVVPMSTETKLAPVRPMRLDELFTLVTALCLCLGFWAAIALFVAQSFFLA